MAPATGWAAVDKWPEIEKSSAGWASEVAANVMFGMSPLVLVYQTDEMNAPRRLMRRCSY